MNIATIQSEHMPNEIRLKKAILEDKLEREKQHTRNITLQGKEIELRMQQMREKYEEKIAILRLQKQKLLNNNVKE